MAVNKFLKKRNINNRNKFQQKKRNPPFSGWSLSISSFFFGTKKEPTILDPKKKAQKKKDFFGGKRFELRRKRKKIPAKYKIDIQQVKPKKKNLQKKKENQNESFMASLAQGIVFLFFFF